MSWTAGATDEGTGGIVWPGWTRRRGVWPTPGWYWDRPRPGAEAGGRQPLGQGRPVRTSGPPLEQPRPARDDSATRSDGSEASSGAAAGSDAGLADVESPSSLRKRAMRTKQKNAKLRAREEAALGSKPHRGFADGTRT